MWRWSSSWVGGVLVAVTWAAVGTEEEEVMASTALLLLVPFGDVVTGVPSRVGAACVAVVKMRSRSSSW